MDFAKNKSISRDVFATTTTTTPTTQFQIQPKKKFPIPIDVIILFILILASFVYCLCYYFAAEMSAIYAYSCNALTAVHTRVARSLVSRRLLFSSFFGMAHRKLYPPHFHLSSVHEKEKICFENCYQTFAHLKPVSEFCIEPQHFVMPLRKWDLWGLDLALRTRLDDIHYLAIRNVSVTLLQNILLWLEGQVAKSRNPSAKKLAQELLHDKVQETFDALFHEGNILLKEDNFQGGHLPRLERLLQDLVPEDHQLPTSMQFQPRYPISHVGVMIPEQDHKTLSTVTHSEKMARIQIVLTWMMWKFAPENYVGYCGQKLYEDTRGSYENMLAGILFMFDFNILGVLLDYLFFRS